MKKKFIVPPMTDFQLNRLKKPTNENLFTLDVFIRNKDL